MARRFGRGFGGKEHTRKQAGVAARLWSGVSCSSGIPYNRNGALAQSVSGGRVRQLGTEGGALFASAVSDEEGHD